jgi:RNA polymerase sigma factor (sigma-70 family)
MGQALDMAAESHRQLDDAIAKQGPRLRRFVRRRVADAAEAEDILQDVFAALIEAWPAPQPIEQVGAWLFRVARNRITDFFRRKRPQSLEDLAALRFEVEEGPGFEDLLPSPEAGPEAAYALGVLLDELDAALGELPPEQRFVFIAHEIEGRSFNDLAAQSGVALNTLLSRKRYAVLHLRERLQEIYDEFMETGGNDR